MTNNVMFVSTDNGSEICPFRRSGLDYFFNSAYSKNYLLILVRNYLGENRSNLHLKRAAYRFCIEISLCEDVN